jgi:hypothetical protein
LRTRYGGRYLGLGEVTGNWRKLHNEEFHGFYSSPDIIRSKEDEMGGACVMCGGEDKCI